MNGKGKYIIPVLGLTLLSFPALGGTPGTGAAAAATSTSPAAGSAPAAKQAANPVHGSLTAGAGYLTEGSYKFGEWTGLVNQGPYPVLDFNLGQMPNWKSTNPHYWQISGSNLGLPSNSAEAQVGTFGSYSLNFSYQGIPHYQWQNAQTPYTLVNGNYLRLPAHFGGLDTSSEAAWDQTVDSNLKPNLHDVNLKTQRDISTVTYRVNLDSHWSVVAEVRHDHKDGTIDFGSPMASFGSGGPQSVLLPLPVKYNINQVRVESDYRTGALDMAVAYLGSFYHDDLNGYIWDNPYINPASNSGYEIGGRGRASTPPDNVFNQMLVSGSWGAPFWSSHVIWDAAYGLEEQSAALLPYTINPNITINHPLPVSNPNMEVRTTQANLRWVMSPLERMELSAAFRYDNHADQSPTYGFYPVVNDSGSQASEPFYNVPYSYQTRTGQLNLAYNFGSVRPFLSYQYKESDQSFVEVGTTQSNKVSGGFNWQPGEITQIRLTGAYDRRHGTPYMNSYRFQLEETGVYNPAGDTNPQDPANFALWSNNPFLRMFWLADRTRRTADLSVDFTPAGPFSVGLDGQYSYDNYTDSTLGLLTNKTQTYTVEAGYNPTRHFGASVYGTYERMTFDQAGISFPGYAQAQAFNFDNYWLLGSTNPIYVAGLNLDAKNLKVGLRNPMDIKFNVAYSYSLDELVMSTGSAQTASAGTFPNLTSRLLHIGVSGSYYLTERFGMQFGVGWEHYDSTDWHFTGVHPWTVGPNEAVLTLGQQAPTYSVYWFSLAATYKF